MRILYITDALAIYGGLERVVTQKVNWFAEHDNEVCLLTTNQGRHPLCFPLNQDVQYEDLNILFHLQYKYSGLRRVLKRRELNLKFQNLLASKIKTFVPDIIICVKLEYNRTVIRVKGNTPFVYESHSSCLSGIFGKESFIRRLYKWFLKLSLNKVNAVVTLTNGDAKEWLKYTSNVYVIPNVVSLNNGGLSDCSSKSAIFVGRFAKQKDLHSLLKIWSIVCQRYPDWKLNIYGGYGDMQDEIKTKISNMGGGVVVHDPSSELIAKYKESSMLLFTSMFEPFGLVLPEAMSCGIPVVAFDCPYGPAEIVSDGLDGFLIRSRSIDTFVDKICLLIDDVNLRREMGKIGAQSSQRYNASRVMPMWIDLFSELIS